MKPLALPSDADTDSGQISHICRVAHYAMCSASQVVGGISQTDTIIAACDGPPVGVIWVFGLSADWISQQVK